MKISELFKFGIKNSKLYSDVLYKYQDTKEEKIPIYSSQENILGYFPISKLNPKSVYSTKEALIMYRQGKAGTLFIPFHNKWTCSENAIPMLLKSEYNGKINFKYLIRLIQGLIYEKTTGKSDNANANWDMIKDIEFDYNHNDKFIREYEKSGELQNKLRDLLILFNNIKELETIRSDA